MGGGVGEAYPGSTGGEFFNYYGTDNNKNEASGDYSSTFGYNNKNTAPKLLMCGSNNQTPGANTNANGGLIAGYNNNVKAIDGAAICLGGNNVVYGNNQIFIGYDNYAQGSSSPKSICVGRGLAVSFTDLKQKVVLGTYNIDAATLTSEKGRLQTIIGGGDSDYAGHRHNAMEVYSSLNGNYKCCVLFPDQIALSNYTTSNKAYVNAITPPQDPNNVTANDTTLVTKSYVDSQVTSKSLSYQPASERQLNIYTSYSIATLLGLATWEFPFSGGGSMDFVFSYSSAPNRNIWYRCHIPLPSYLNSQNTPKINVALAQISHYPITNDSNGELQGILLEYDTAAKTIQFIGGEGVIVNNGSDTLQTAYNQGDLHPWFWGLTCNTFI